jgi:hypothetical protein
LGFAHGYIDARDWGVLHIGLSLYRASNRFATYDAL